MEGITLRAHPDRSALVMEYLSLARQYWDLIDGRRPGPPDPTEVKMTRARLAEIREQIGEGR